jgi:hypothetical protein
MNKYYNIQKIAKDNSLTPEAFSNFAATAEGQKALGNVSTGEVATTAAGAGLGGLAGFLLSKKYNKDASPVTRILHSISGAAVGGAGAQLLLHAVKDPYTGMTLADKFRINSALGTESLNNAISEATEQRRDNKEHNKAYTVISTLTGAAALGKARNLVHLPNGASRSLNRALHRVSTPMVRPLTSAKDFLGSRLSRKAPLASTRGALSTHFTSSPATINRINARAANRLSKGIRAFGKGTAAYSAGALLGYALDKYVLDRI